MMRLAREPLLHFLLVGGLLFAAEAMVTDDAPPGDQVIRIGAQEIAALQTQWQGLHRRPPTAAELQGLLDARVREEVLFREAVAMGLDQDDSIVRRRLAQKLEFMIEDFGAAREPGEAELVAFFAARQDAYRLPGRISFSQVYFSPDHRGPAAEADARLALAGLRPDVPVDAAADLGDRFLPGESYRQQSAWEIEAVFGPAFAQALLEVEAGAWAGPIASAYGWHLVRVEARAEGWLPPLAEVADRVRQDWAVEQRRSANQAVVERLLARYELVIEAGDDWLALAADGVGAEGRP
jgi:peptidyl-prolyl cis-trans isomerase C